MTFSEFGWGERQKSERVAGQCCCGQLYPTKQDGKDANGQV